MGEKCESDSIKIELSDDKSVQLQEQHVVEVETEIGDQNDEDEDLVSASANQRWKWFLAFMIVVLVISGAVFATVYLTRRNRGNNEDDVQIPNNGGNDLQVCSEK